MRQKIKQLIILFLLIAFLIIPYFVFAAEPANPTPNTSPTLQSVLKDLGGSAGYETTVDENSFSKFIGKIINIFLSILGLIFIILIVYAGYKWMTASGDATKLDKAKDTIWRAVIGLVITVGAYAIWNFLFTRLIK